MSQENITDILIKTSPDSPSDMQRLAGHPYSALKKYDQVRKNIPDLAVPVRMRILFQLYNPKSKRPSFRAGLGLYENIPGMRLEFSIWSVDGMFEAIKRIFGAFAKPENEEKP